MKTCSLRCVLAFLLSACGVSSVQAASLNDMISKEGLVQGNSSMTTWVVKEHINQRDKALFLSIWGKQGKDGQLRWGVIGQEAEDRQRPQPGESRARWLINPAHQELVFMPSTRGLKEARIYVRQAGEEAFSVFYQRYREQQRYATDYVQVYAIPNVSADERYFPRYSQAVVGEPSSASVLTRNLLAAYRKPDATGSSALTLFEAHNRVLAELPGADAGITPLLIKGLLVFPHGRQEGLGIIPTLLDRDGLEEAGKVGLLSQTYVALGLHEGFVHGLSPDRKLRILNPSGVPVESAVGDIVTLPTPVQGARVRHASDASGRFMFESFFVDMRLHDGRPARRLLIRRADHSALMLFPGPVPEGDDAGEYGDMVFLGQGGDRDFFAAQRKSGAWDAFALAGDGRAERVHWAASSGRRGAVSVEGDPFAMLALLQENQSLRVADQEQAYEALKRDKPAFVRHVMQSVRRDKFGIYQPQSDFQTAERYAGELGGDLLAEWLLAFNKLSGLDEKAIAELLRMATDSMVQKGLEQELANRAQARRNQEIAAQNQAEQRARARERSEAAARADALLQGRWTGAPGLSALEQDYYVGKGYVIIRKPR